MASVTSRYDIVRVQDHPGPVEGEGLPLQIIKYHINTIYMVGNTIYMDTLQLIQKVEVMLGNTKSPPEINKKEAIQFFTSIFSIYCSIYFLATVTVSSIINYNYRYEPS